MGGDGGEIVDKRRKLIDKGCLVERARALVELVDGELSIDECIVKEGGGTVAFRAAQSLTGEVRIAHATKASTDLPSCLGVL